MSFLRKTIRKKYNIKNLLEKKLGGSAPASASNASRRVKAVLLKLSRKHKRLSQETRNTQNEHFIKRARLLSKSNLEGQPHNYNFSIGQLKNLDERHEKFLSSARETQSEKTGRKRGVKCDAV